MSNCIGKTRSSDSEKKAREKSNLLLGILSRASDMPSCSACESERLECRASVSDSSRCEECFRKNRTFCDVNGLSHAQARRIVDKHQKAEAELEAAEEAALAANLKVARLRKQRKLWADKVARMIRRGLSSLEELDEVEERERQEELERQRNSVSEASEPVPPIDWSSVDFSALVDPSLLASVVPDSSDEIVQQPERRSPGVS